MKDEKAFLYVPFQHEARALADQRHSVALFTALGDDWHNGCQEAPGDHRALRPIPAPQPDARPGAASGQKVATGDVKPW